MQFFTAQLRTPALAIAVKDIQMEMALETMLWLIIGFMLLFCLLIIGFMLLFCLILWPFRRNQATLKLFEAEKVIYLLNEFSMNSCYHEYSIQAPVHVIMRTILRLLTMSCVY